MKKTYISPALQVITMALTAAILTGSNHVSNDGNSVHLNASTMQGGDGGDAVKGGGSYDVWKDDWSK